MLNLGQHRLLINVPVPAPGWNLSGNARHLGEKRGGGGGGEGEEEGRERVGEEVGTRGRLDASSRINANA